MKATFNILLLFSINSKFDETSIYYRSATTCCMWRRIRQCDFVLSMLAVYYYNKLIITVVYFCCVFHFIRESNFGSAVRVIRYQFTDMSTIFTHSFRFRCFRFRYCDVIIRDFSRILKTLFMVSVTVKKKILISGAGSVCIRSHFFALKTPTPTSCFYPCL